RVRRAGRWRRALTRIDLGRTARADARFVGAAVALAARQQRIVFRLRVGRAIARAAVQTQRVRARAVAGLDDLRARQRAAAVSAATRRIDRVLDLIDATGQADQQERAQHGASLHAPGYAPCVLHVESTGSGPPVVLLHSSGMASRQFARLIPKLVESGYRAVAIDLAGHGRSPALAEGAAFSWRDDVDAVRAVIEEPASLVGHSYGGLVALHVALAAADRVKGL